MKRQLVIPVLLIFSSVILSIYATAKIDDTDTQLAVLFPFQNSLQKNINLAVASKTNIVRVGAINQILIVEKLNKDSMMELYNQGALLVFNPTILGECNAQKASLSAFKTSETKNQDK